MKSKLSIALLTLALALPPSTLTASSLPQDQGAAGVYQKLLKLKTTASAMHTTAHPDDEHGGVLAQLSREQGARMALLTLNRGESGDNAIGSELFDGLGLIRTEELIVSDRYYGVDDQYFTTVTDYGFSKRLDEAFEKWGKENVLRDVVRIIRMNRPFVLISRFQGNRRDGHGNHQTAGLITREAFKAAGDPNMFPEQIAQGLRPWRPMKVYIGGQRENEEWMVKVDPGTYSPWLGETYNNFARIGLSFQRSQNSGQLRLGRGPQAGYYQRVDSTVTSPAREQGFFDGIDTTIPGLFKALGRTAPEGAEAALQSIDREVAAAFSAFSLANPSATVPALARGLKATRDAIASLDEGEPDATFILGIKEKQFQAAITAALAIDFTATAQPAGLPEPTGQFAAFAAPPTMAAPVPGQTFEVRALLTNRSPVPLTMRSIELDVHPGWNVSRKGAAGAGLNTDETADQRFSVTLSADVALSSKPYFTRPSIQQARYDIEDASQAHRPNSVLPATAVARYTVLGVDVEAREIVTRREANLPYGHELRELRVVPALALSVTPGSAVVPLKAVKKQVPVEVDLLNNVEGDIAGELMLKLPAGWTSSPASQPFKYARAGERSVYRFTVNIPSLENRSYDIQAVARANGREYVEGYSIIEKRDLETRLLYRPSTIGVRGIDVTVPEGLKVGYVMGVGDQVPSGIAQLGAAVTLLGRSELASADLSQFDTIMTGTRAYAVRDDLKTYNHRLLEYVEGGGNLVILYNTPGEFEPGKWAPYPAVMPARAEEVSEEDSPVEILAPTEPVFNFPNKITAADFENWVEQRGSKFLGEWDKAYTPMIATWDRDQAKQSGGWVHAAYGKGHYTYFAYAFHRQLPYGVPGAYRLLANVLSLNKTPATASK